MKYELIKKAEELGFLGIGFNRPERPFYFEEYKTWISDGKQGDMAWMSRHQEIREDPTRLLGGCRTIISLAYPYSSKKPGTPDGYTVSRYSAPAKEDYHGRLKKLCFEIVSLVEELFKDSRCRICVDSAPILERSYALSAGLGFIGNNNMLIIPGYGSYFYLAEILTTAAIDFSEAKQKDSQCGNCVSCVEACPTGALEGPFSFDASKCLSYLTIEYKGEVSRHLAGKMDKCFFGCDRCQEVCLFNREEEETDIQLPVTGDFMEMSEDKFKEKYGHTALARRGLAKIQSNIRAMI